MQRGTVLVLDFGGQYSQLIARRVREAKVYCEIWPYSVPIEKIKAAKPKGMIFTGGPKSVYGKDAPHIDKVIFSLGIPILGICYGSQLMAHLLGGEVERGEAGEYGRTGITLSDSVLFTGVSKETSCWMSHGDRVSKLPEGFSCIGWTNACPVAAMEDRAKKLYGVQFHPEVLHTPEGQKVLENFLYKICRCTPSWTMASFVEQAVADIRKQVGDKKALLALSGGVDSSVCAALVSRAIGRQLTCIFVDHGLLRKGEAEQVEKLFRGQFDINLDVAHCEDRFLDKLAGVVDPEQKRKIIGKEFIRVFEDEAKKLGHMDFLVQGTIYPDIIESGRGDAATIKSHHNVGGLPEDIKFSGIIEPLRDLFKDEVRAVGETLGLPESIVWRQPFPGPGLAVRCIGEVTREKLNILREADAIFCSEIEKAGLARQIWQYFAVLTDMRSVGVMGDERTYEHTIALRAVTGADAMTADWAKIPFEILESVSNRIVSQVRHVNRVVYDITTKPPATIEWE
ncbi:MAG: glutamine-hydrolyzing GMP synthase [Bacillota bacterium]|nr:glutamine-hydrolyzing GMP synthase [Bacillota bacterium]